MGDMEGISIVHINLGKLASEQGDLDASEYHYREGLQIAEHLNSAYYTTNARVGLAKVQLMQGNLTTAQETVERCQIEAKTVHAQELLIESRCIQAEILLEQAHADKAEALARESAIMAREVGIPGLEAAAWRLAGTCQIYRGLFSEAHHSLQEARHALASVTDHLEQARLSVQLGKLYLAEGRASEAMAYLHSAQVVFSRLGAQYDLEQLAQIRGDIEATPGTGHR